MKSKVSTIKIMDQQNYFLDLSETQSNDSDDYPYDLLCGICRDMDKMQIANGLISPKERWRNR